MRILHAFMVMVLSSFLFVSFSSVHAQQSPSVEYLNVQPSDYIIWKYQNQTVVYQKTQNAFTKIYGPSSFQSVTSTYVTDNYDPAGCMPYPPAGSGLWQDYWNTNLTDMRNWYVNNTENGKYIVAPVYWEMPSDTSGGTYDDYVLCVYYIDLETLAINKRIVRTHYLNTSGYYFAQQTTIQLTKPVTIYGIVDRPSDIIYYVASLDPMSSFFTSQIDGGIDTGSGYSVVARSDLHALVSVITNNCLYTSYEAQNHRTVIITPSSVTTTYYENGVCDSTNPQEFPDPLLNSITWSGKAGGSVYVTQDGNNYICDTNPNATTTIAFFANCLQVDSFPQSYTIPLPAYVRTSQQLLNAGNIAPHYLFTTTNASFFKSQYLMPIDSNRILSVNSGMLLTNSNITPYVVKLYSERGGNVYTEDPQFLVSTSSGWFIRKSVFDPSTNTTTNTDYPIADINLSNGIEISTLSVYLNPSNDTNTRLYLVWRTTMNNETYERVWELQWLKQFQLSAAGIDMTQNLTLAEHTVIFTDPNLANTTMFVKAMGSNILVNQTKTSPDRFKMLAVEGNCYTVNKMNQTFTFLANFCAVAPYITTVGASDGSEGNILIGVYWFPQWWVTHIYYEQNNTVDVIIHKTPPFTYKIVIKDGNNNIVIDTGYQTGNSDPLTRNLSLSQDSKHYLTVYGKETNRELVVYTAEIARRPSLPQFLPNINYSGINVIFIVAIVSMLMWTRNNASVGIVITVVALAILNYLGLLKINDSLFALLIFLAGAGIVISKKLFS